MKNKKTESKGEHDTAVLRVDIDLEFAQIRIYKEHLLKVKKQPFAFCHSKQSKTYGILVKENV